MSIYYFIFTVFVIESNVRGNEILALFNLETEVMHLCGGQRSPDSDPVFRVVLLSFSLGKKTAQQVDHLF